MWTIAIDDINRTITTSMDRWCGLPGLHNDQIVISPIVLLHWIARKLDNAAFLRYFLITTHKLWTGWIPPFIQIEWRLPELLRSDMVPRSELFYHRRRGGNQACVRTLLFVEEFEVKREGKVCASTLSFLFQRWIVFQYPYCIKTNHVRFLTSQKYCSRSPCMWLVRTRTIRYF